MVVRVAEVAGCPERDDPPVLVGQIETARTDPLPDLLAPLDVCFVGSTDLAVDLGLPEDPAVLRAAVDRVRGAARSAAVRCTTSTSRPMRSRLASEGTSSSSLSWASVPGRGE